MLFRALRLVTIFFICITSLAVMGLPSAAEATPTNTSSGDTMEVTFEWDAVCVPGYAGSIGYDVEIAYDINFNNIITSLYQEEGDYCTDTRWAYDGLKTDQTYYWRVRVAKPVTSLWSPGIIFTTSLISNIRESMGLDAKGRVHPDNGATDVTSTPIFTWGAVDLATSYQFRLATDITFSELVDSQTGITNTFYAPAVALKAGLTYFWEVRAVNAVATSDWLINVFKTSE